MKKMFTALMVVLLALTLFVGCDPNDSAIEPPKKENPSQNPDNEVVDPPDEDDLSPTPDKNEQKYEVVLYFPDSDLLATYRIKTEILAQEDELAKAALEAWLAGPEHKELNY